MKKLFYLSLVIIFFGCNSKVTVVDSIEFKMASVGAHKKIAKDTYQYFSSDKDKYLIVSMDDDHEFHLKLHTDNKVKEIEIKGGSFQPIWSPDNTMFVVNSRMLSTDSECYLFKDLKDDKITRIELTSAIKTRVKGMSHVHSKVIGWSTDNKYVFIELNGHGEMGSQKSFYKYSIIDNKVIHAYTLITEPYNKSLESTRVQLRCPLVAQLKRSTKKQ